MPSGALATTECVCFRPNSRIRSRLLCSGLLTVDP